MAKVTFCKRELHRMSTYSYYSIRHYVSAIEQTSISKTFRIEGRKCVLKNTYKSFE